MYSIPRGVGRVGWWPKKITVLEYMGVLGKIIELLFLSYDIKKKIKYEVELSVHGKHPAIK